MSKKYLFVTIFLLVLALAGGIYVITFNNTQTSPVASLPSPTISGTIEASAEPVATGSGNNKNMVQELKIEDEIVGTGTEATSGRKVTVNYAGTLTDGTKFDSSYDRNQPFVFNLGAGEVIKGWDQGVIGMKVGGKRKLTVPSNLAYGDQGIPGAIPGGATLIFEVELLKVE